MPKPGGTPKKISIDFTGIERGSGGANPHVPEGDYLAQVLDCEYRSKKDDPSKKSLRWKLKYLEGNKKAIGKIHRHTTGLSKEALWSLRGFLIDLLGEDKVPQRALDVPIAAIVKAKPKIGITMTDDDYNNKETSKVSGTFPKADWPALKAAAEAEDDEDEEEDEIEVEEEDDEEEDEDEEEEEEAPKKKAKKAKPEKKAKKKAKKPAVEDDEDEDDEDELDVDDL